MDNFFFHEKDWIYKRVGLKIAGGRNICSRNYIKSFISINDFVPFSCQHLETNTDQIYSDCLDGQPYISHLLKTTLYKTLEPHLVGHHIWHMSSPVVTHESFTRTKTICMQIISMEKSGFTKKMDMFGVLSWLHWFYRYKTHHHNSRLICNMERP